MIWSNFKQSSFKRCIVAFNDTYRMLFNIRRGVSMSQIYMANDIDCFKVILRKMVYKFKVRLTRSNNSVVKSPISSQFYVLASSLSRKWQEVLYI